jgi:hypothetical protein
VLVVAFFVGATHLGFLDLYDDGVNIVRHHHDLRRVWGEPYEGLYIPLTYTVWTALWKLSAGPWAFHGVNVLLHAAAAVAVYRLAKPHFPRTAVVAALFFAIEPFQVEPVAWATGLKDTLSGCLVLFGLLAHQGRREATAFTLALLATLAKPSAVAFVPLALIVRPSATVLWYVLAVAPAGVSFFVQTAAQPPDFAWRHRVHLALSAIGHYLTQEPSPDQWVKGLGEYDTDDYGVMILAVSLWGRFARGARFYVAALLPTLGLVPFIGENWSVVADRYSYVAMAGGGMMLAAMIETALAKRELMVLAGPVLVVAAALVGYATLERVRLWESERRLFFSASYWCPPHGWNNKHYGLGPACTEFKGKSNCVFIPKWALDYGVPHFWECDWTIKPNAAMLLSLAADRAGDSDEANMFMEEARKANAWKETRLVKMGAYRTPPEIP